MKKEEIKKTLKMSNVEVTMGTKLNDYQNKIITITEKSLNSKAEKGLVSKKEY